MYRTAAVAFGIGRALLGAGLFAAPGTVASRWIGEASEQPATQEIVRGLGARDVALGAGLLSTLRNGQDPTLWLAAGVVADVADTAAAVLVGDGIPAGGRVGTLALAGGSAVAGVLLARALD